MLPPEHLEFKIDVDYENADLTVAQIGEPQVIVHMRPGGSWRRMLPPGAIGRR